MSSYEKISLLPAGDLIEALMSVGANRRVELTAVAQSRLGGRGERKKTVTAFHVDLTVGHPWVEWKIYAKGRKCREPIMCFLICSCTHPCRTHTWCTWGKRHASVCGTIPNQTIGTKSSGVFWQLQHFRATARQLKSENSKHNTIPMMERIGNRVWLTRCFCEVEHFSVLWQAPCTYTLYD